MNRFGTIEGLEHFIRGDIDGVFLYCSNGAMCIALPAEFDMHITFHECLHAAGRIWYDAGAQIEVPKNDEILTYFMNYLVEQIERIYNAYKE